MEAFKVFDQDGSGKISLEELRNVMLSLGEDLTDQQLRNSLKEHEKFFSKYKCIWKKSFDKFTFLFYA